jgi:hypothetical protein
MDLFVYDRDGGNIKTFLRNDTLGGIHYDYAIEYVDSFPDSLRGYALLLDYNCDGYEDIFSYYNAGSAVYKNMRGITGKLEFTLAARTLRYPPGGSANCYTSNVDVPAFADVDGDGDIDMLSFELLGRFVNYFRNTSMDTYGHCDSLHFEWEDDCWGKFLEGNATNVLDLNFCTFKAGDNLQKQQHSGSTLLAVNFDGNDSTINSPNFDKELIIGDVSYRNAIGAINTYNKDTALVTMQDTLYPSYDQPVDLQFPAGFFADVNGDNKKDLIFAPNSSTATYVQIQFQVATPADNVNNVWYYENSGNNDSVVVSRKRIDFLVGEMIDVGSNANPVLFDYNADGKTDLLIGTHGYFNKTTGLYDGKLTLYENIGSSVAPQFKYITDDYANISILGITALSPCFGDLDDDGDLDMIIGDEQGRIHYYENLAGPLSPANFQLSAAIYSGIDGDDNAIPALFDLNGDTLLDLIIGNEYGTLDYYENTGSKSLASFASTPDISNLGGVDVKDQFNIGFSAPFFTEINGVKGLWVGSYGGHIFYYENISDSTNFVLSDSIVANGKRLTPAFGNLFSKDYDGLVIGHSTGGVSFMKKDITNVAYTNDIMPIEIWPNPTKNSLFIRTAENSSYSIDIYDLGGRLLQTHRTKSTGHIREIRLNSLSSGTYLVHINIDGISQVKKVILQK